MAEKQFRNTEARRTKQRRQTEGRQTLSFAGMRPPPQEFNYKARRMAELRAEAYQTGVFSLSSLKTKDNLTLFLSEKDLSFRQSEQSRRKLKVKALRRSTLYFVAQSDEGRLDLDRQLQPQQVLHMDGAAEGPKLLHDFKIHQGRRMALHIKGQLYVTHHYIQQVVLNGEQLFPGGLEEWQDPVPLVKGDANPNEAE